MAIVRAASFAALLLCMLAGVGLAQDVTLTSRDGDVEISGNLLGFDGEFYRVGGHVPVKVDVRIIAATHQKSRM